MENKAVGSNWNDVRKDIFTSEEIAESDLRVLQISELMETPKESESSLDND